MKNKNKISYTIEFFPEEGKYHWDGHRDCKMAFNPQQTRKSKGICPQCKKPLTVGVLNRVQELADRAESYQDKTRPPYKSLIPLQEVVAEACAKGKQSKTVQTEYERLCRAGTSEFNILLNMAEAELKEIAAPEIVMAIIRMRRGQVDLVPGFDGVYGKIKIFSEADRRNLAQQAKLL